MRRPRRSCARNTRALAGWRRRSYCAEPSLGHATPSGRRFPHLACLFSLVRQQRPSPAQRWAAFTDPSKGFAQASPEDQGSVGADSDADTSPKTLGLGPLP